MATRIKVTTEDGELAGWFNKDAAEAYRESSNWNGRNWVGVESGISVEFCWVGLYRTAGGRWVLRENMHSYMDSRVTTVFLDDEEARIWLIRNDHDDAVLKHFGPMEEEAVL